MVKFEIKRSMTLQNIAELSPLFQASEQADNYRPLNDHLWLDLRQGGRPGFAGLIARNPDSQDPIAYCQISRGNGSWAIYLVIAPKFRSQTHELGTELLTNAVQIIASERGGHVDWWVPSPTPEHNKLAEELNFKVGRRLLQMRVALPLAKDVITATKIVSTHSFQVGTDEDAWIAVNNRAFSSHPEQGGFTREVLQDRQTEKWFNPQGFLLHFTEDSKQLDAFCWTKIDDQGAAAERTGEIYVIAVDPRFQGQGLGRSLTVAGLQYLTSAGATTGMLFVDQDNAAAVATYKKLGFTEHHEQQAFVGDIAGVSPSKFTTI